MINRFQTLKRAVVCESILVAFGDRRGILENAVWSLVCEKFLDTRRA